MNLREQLETMTVIVADTGDIESIRQHTPRDATTNPSLLLAAAQMPAYASLVKDAIDHAGGRLSPDMGSTDAAMRTCLERLAVNFGKEILNIIPGRVSVEVDASLSFHTEATMQTARRIIASFAEAGIDRERILIKIASTWEGIKAAEQLEKEGIHCNLTLLFSFAQAVACAEARVTLISPFVGRILDWYKADRGVEHIDAPEDPGVLSVTRIYQYYKCFGYSTEVMGASFRNAEEIVELAGCDLLTISPGLLEELAASQGDLSRKLDPATATALDIEKISLNEEQFRWMMNEDAMATEKLADGIRRFNADNVQLAKSLADT